MIIAISLIVSLAMIVLVGLIPYLIYKKTTKENIEIKNDTVSPEIKEKRETFSACIFSGLVILAFSAASYFSGEIIVPSGNSESMNPEGEPSKLLFVVLFMLYAGIGSLIYGIWGHIKYRKA